jgi:hypothetical protein
MSIIKMVLLAAVLSAGLAADATAFTYNSIAGRWCGEGLTYTFTRGQLTVEFSNGTPTRYFKIVRYRYPQVMVTVEWIDAEGKQVHTDFAEFSANGRYRAQVPSNAGPRRPFHRC